MSAITSDWTPAETNAPTTQAVDGGEFHRREEEFRSALANYMAGYVADQQQRRTEETAARNGYFTVVRRFAGWMRGGRSARADLGRRSDRTPSPPKIPSEKNGYLGSYAVGVRLFY